MEIRMENGNGKRRAIWSGTISVGLLNVGVKAHTATRDNTKHFNQITPQHEHTYRVLDMLGQPMVDAEGKPLMETETCGGTRVKQALRCERCGETIAKETVKKGYELSKNNYVILEPTDLEAIEPASSKVVNVEGFVAQDRQRELNISKEQAEEIVETLDRRHDAELGISWDTIDVYLDELEPKVPKVPA